MHACTCGEAYFTADALDLHLYIHRCLNSLNADDGKEHRREETWLTSLSA